MRILCLIMVGAFLLSIAIADNGDFSRLSMPNSPSIAHHNSGARSNVPWASQRVTQDGSVPHPSNDVGVDDNVASPDIYAPQYTHREPKPVQPAVERSMILEPMHRPHSFSWSDYLPDFFGDDPPEGPGPLIGPMSFPGLGNQVFIRQNEPLDDDTNHVVIHLINRESLMHPQSAPPPPPTPSSPPPLPLSSSNNSPYFNKVTHTSKDTAHYTESIYPPSVMTSVPEYNYNRDPFPNKISNAYPWKLQSNSIEKEIKDKNFQQAYQDGKDGNLYYPHYDDRDRILQYPSYFNGMNLPNKNLQSKFTNQKQNRPQEKQVAWSQPFSERDVVFGRSMNYNTNQKGPITFPAGPKNGDTPSNSSFVTLNQPIPSPQPAVHRPLPLTWLQKYSHQNRTRAAGASARAGAAPGFKQPQNYLDEISMLSRAEASRRTHLNHADPSARLSGGDVAHRQPRNQLYGVRQFVAKVNDSAAQPPQPKIAQMEVRGGLQEIQAPNLERRENKGEDVMQKIMSMTASQKWKPKKNSNLQPKKAATSTTTTQTMTQTTTQTTTPSPSPSPRLLPKTKRKVEVVTNKITISESYATINKFATVAQRRMDEETKETTGSESEDKKSNDSETSGNPEAGKNESKTEDSKIRSDATEKTAE